MLLWIIIAVVLILIISRVVAIAMAHGLELQRRYEAEQEIQDLKRQTVQAMFTAARSVGDDRSSQSGSDVIEGEAWD
jgi:flagellar basal body-associated protein FliL